MEKSRISAEELSERLVGAKKIMRKVDVGDFERGAISENIIQAPEGELISSPQPPSQPPPQTSTTNPNLHKAPRQVSERQIRESKLPEAIKQAMIDNPIAQIGLNDTLDMNFVEKTKQLMERDGVSTNKQKQQPQQETRSVKSENNSSVVSDNDLEKRLAPIIENVIRKTLDEIVDRKLNQILSASQGQTINENLAIKVGDTIFTGKLTKAKSSK